MRICVLVVDDDAPILTAIARGFAHKWTVTQCTSPDDALEILEGPTPFDAIMLDLYMAPGMSGIEIYEALEVSAPARRERVIFYTGGGARDGAVKWLNEQNRPVLMKPVDFTAIEHTVTRVVTEATTRRIPRGPHFTPPPTERDDRFEEFATRLEKRLLSSMKDSANTRGASNSAPPPTTHHKSLKSIADDDDDPAAEITDHGGIRIPQGSWLEAEINKAVEAREKRLALELAAGRWGNLVAWWQEWWKRLGLALLVLVAGIAAREIVVALLFAVKHVH